MQFASTPADNRVWAIKFFLSPTAFENESVLYAAHYPELRSQLPVAAAERAAALKRAVQSAGPLRSAGASAKFLPRVELSVGLHGGLMDPKGMPLPPCVVMEKGESLLEWWAHIEQSPHAAQRVRLSILCVYVFYICCPPPPAMQHRSVARALLQQCCFLALVQFCSVSEQPAKARMLRRSAD